MIWYLLYPFRGTTEPPVLPPSHPLRQSFTRYARWIAVHVQFTFPASIVLAFLLTYPMFFLYTTDTTAVTNGASNLPHHVWTDARSLEGYASPEPDVIMRSVWVHGNYMGALHRDVLLGALELQNELLGPTENFSPRQTGRPEATKPPLRDLRLEERDGFHITNGLTNQSWFFHSPLKYWSCSAANIRADPDLLATVNTKKTLSTTVNVTLRHSIVFSGKRFEERRLVAADALVITLLHLRDSPVAEQWVRKTESLARESKTKWVVIPADGKTNASQLYEFQFRPISRLDSFFLAVAYVLAALYVTAGLSRFHAVKSKTSLMAAILLQMASSIASSFTVCAVFKLDVSRVPYYAYPLVMLAISMENSLRLVNAVIMNSSVVNTNDRIGEAFGETAHIAMAHRFGNLALLLLLSWVTYPGVAAFCTFAAIATVFDFVYLSTLFLLVLKLDVRQRELSDMVKAIGPQAQTAAHRSRGTATGPRTLADLFSLTPTHVAGTAVLLAVVLVADYHAIGCHHVGKLSRHRPLGDGQASSTSSLAQIHQARSPPSWLRLQDHETAREVIHAIKPWAHSYVARVYDPVVFVLRGSDRTPPTAEPVLLPAVYDFVHHQIPRYLALAGLLFWLLHLLTSYLARDEEAMVAWHQNHPYGESLLTVKSLAGCHTLDVLMLASAHQDRLVSVGLDRVVGVWDLRLGLQAKVKTKPGHAPNPFPLLAIALDADSKWLAFLSPHELLMWNVAQQRWGPSVDLEVGGTNPEAFFFVDRAGESAEAVVIVKRDGIMLEVEPATGEVEETVVCKTPLIWAGGFAVQQALPGHGTSRTGILTISRKRCIHLVTQHGSCWASEEVSLPYPTPKDAHCIVPLPAAGPGLFLVGRKDSVDLVDLRPPCRILHTFATEPMAPRSLKLLYTSRATAPARLGLLASLTLAYASAKTGDLVLQTYLPPDRDCAISDSACGGVAWGAAREVRRRVARPGAWETLRDGCVVGVRRRVVSCPGPADGGGSGSGTDYPTTTTTTTTTGLRHRSLHVPTATARASVQDEWEAWVMSQLDREEVAEAHWETRALGDEDDTHDGGRGGGGGLLIAELGPMVRVGAASVAFGFGAGIKIVSVARGRFGGVAPGKGLGPGGEGLVVGGRRRKGGKAAGRRGG